MKPARRPRACRRCGLPSQPRRRRDPGPRASCPHVCARRNRGRQPRSTGAAANPPRPRDARRSTSRGHALRNRRAAPVTVFPAQNQPEGSIGGSYVHLSHFSPGHFGRHRGARIPRPSRRRRGLPGCAGVPARTFARGAALAGKRERRPLMTVFRAVETCAGIPPARSRAARRRRRATAFDARRRQPTPTARRSSFDVPRPCFS